MEGHRGVDAGSGVGVGAGPSSESPPVTRGSDAWISSHLIIGLLLGAISGCPGIAAAQTPSADAQARVETLEARIRELEQRLASARGLPATAQAPLMLPPVADGASLLVVSAVTNSSPAPPPPTLEALESEIEQLDQQIRIVARQLELDREQATERAKTTPVGGRRPRGVCHALRRWILPAAAARVRAVRRAVLRGRRCGAGRRHIRAAASPAHPRGHALQKLRLPSHT